MSLNLGCLILLIDSNFDHALCFLRSGKHGHARVGWQSANSFRIIACVYSVYQTQICEIIDIDAIFENYNYFIFPQLHSFNKSFEAKFPNAFVLVVVPEKDFIHRKLRVWPSSYKGQNVASKEHFNNAYSSIKFSFKGVFKGIGIVDLETFLGSTSKASLILIEPYV